MRFLPPCRCPDGTASPAAASGDGRRRRHRRLPAAAARFRPGPARGGHRGGAAPLRRRRRPGRPQAPGRPAAAPGGRTALCGRPRRRLPGRPDRLALVWTSLRSTSPRAAAQAERRPPGARAARRSEPPPASANAAPPSADAERARTRPAVEPGATTRRRSRGDAPGHRAAPAASADESPGRPRPTRRAGGEDRPGRSSSPDRGSGGPNLEFAVPMTSSAASANASGPGRPAARRGDWNACTVEDPEARLSRCRRVATVARGARRATAHISEAGLERPGRAIGRRDRRIRPGDRSGAAILGRLSQPRPRLAAPRRPRPRARRSRPGGALRPAIRAAYYHRSLILRQRGDIRRARADEARAVELDPEFARVLRSPR